jgi:hypothetical protein
LIDSILKDLHFSNVNAASTPAASTVILDRDESGKPFDESSTNGPSLESSSFWRSQPDRRLLTRFTKPIVSPSHRKSLTAMLFVVCVAISHILMPTLEGNTFQVWVDADFLGLWNKETAPHDPSTARSRTGFVITYAGCPVAWISKREMEVAHSSAEAEYVALSQALRDTIPMMALLQEASNRGVPIITMTTPTFRCTVFEDNSVDMFRLVYCLERGKGNRRQGSSTASRSCQPC